MRTVAELMRDDLTVPDETAGRSVFGLSSATRTMPKEPPRPRPAPPGRRQEEMGWFGLLVAGFAILVIAVANGLSISVILERGLSSPGFLAAGAVEARLPVPVSPGVEGTTTSTTSVASPTTTPPAAGSTREHVTTASPSTSASAPVTTGVSLGTSTTVASPTTTASTTTAPPPAFVSPDYDGSPGCSDARDVSGCDPNTVCPNPDYPHFVADPPPRCVP